MRWHAQRLGSAGDVAGAGACPVRRIAGLGDHQPPAEDAWVRVLRFDEHLH